jgi:tetratricopeptide (TPR) repeat protein
MRKSVFLVLIVVFFSFAFVASANDIKTTFYEARASQNATEMLALIQKLEKMPSLSENATSLKILTDACVEYGLWGAKDDEKAKYFDDGIKYANMAIKLKPKDAYLYFVKGAAIGRLAQYRGIIQSLFMLRDFDHAINKAIELDPKLYRAYVALAMRYRDTPWPFANFGKSEKLFLEAIKLDPHYVYAYYELANLYLKWGKKKEAKKIFIEMSKMSPEKDFYAQESQNIQFAKKWLEENK